MPTSSFLLSIRQKPHKFVRDYTARFNIATQEIPDFSEKEFIQAYRHELYNTTF